MLQLTPAEAQLIRQPNIQDLLSKGELEVVQDPEFFSQDITYVRNTIHNILERILMSQAKA